MAPYMVKTEKPIIPNGVPQYLAQRNHSFLNYRRKVSQDDGHGNHIDVIDQRITHLDNRQVNNSTTAAVMSKENKRSRLIV